MKKTVTLIALILVMAMCVSVYADDAYALKTVRMDEYGMELAFPEGWYVNTKDSIDPDFLAATGNDEESVAKYLKQAKITYNVVAEDLQNELTVVVINNSQSRLAFDFNYVSEETLKKQAETIMGRNDKKKKSPADYQDYEIMKTDQCLFLKLNGNIDEVAFCQYMTAINGYSVSINLRSYDGSINEQEAKLIEDVAKSVHVDEVEPYNKKAIMTRELLPVIILTLLFATAGILIFVNNQKKKNRE